MLIYMRTYLPKYMHKLCNKSNNRLPCVWALLPRGLPYDRSLPGRLTRLIYWAALGNCLTLAPAKTIPGVVIRYLISAPPLTITPSKCT
jgi:hypothetical protein